MTGIETAYGQLLRCVHGKTHEHFFMRYWVSDQNDILLVPDPCGEESDDQ